MLHVLQKVLQRIIEREIEKMHDDGTAWADGFFEELEKRI